MAAPQDRLTEQEAGAERREFPRQQVDCQAVIFPVSGAMQLPGILSDLSLAGCLVVSEQQYTAGILVRVEVQFQLEGIAFRIVGVVAGTRGAKSFAVRFLDLPIRRRDQLVEVLAESAARNLSEAAGEPAVSIAAPSADAAIVPVAR